MSEDTSKTRTAYSAFMRGEFHLARSIYKELAQNIGNDFFKLNITLCNRRLAELEDKSAKEPRENQADPVTSVNEILKVAELRVENTVKSFFMPIPSRVVLIVAHASDHTGKGYATRTKRLAKTIEEEGFEVLCFVQPTPLCGTSSIEANSRSDAIVEGVRYIHSNWMDAVPQSGKAYLEASVKIYMELLKEHRPEVVMTTGDFTSSLPAIIAAKTLSLPVIKEHIHYADAYIDEEPLKYFSSMSFAEKYTVEQVCLSKADRRYYLYPEYAESKDALLRLIHQTIQRSPVLNLLATLSPNGVYTVKRNIDHSGLHYLEVDVQDSDGNPKGLVASFRFFDTKGKRLADALPGFSSSKAYPQYQYVDTMKVNGSGRVLVFSIPEGVGKLEVDLVAFATSGVLTLRKAKLGRLTVGDVACWLTCNIPGIHWIKGVEAYVLSEGASSLRLALLNYKYALSRSPSDLSQLDAAIQEMVELDRTWVPNLGYPGRIMQVKETDKLTVSHLHKTAYPYENTGGAIRCLNTVLSQKCIGIDPYIVTPIGYPRSAGISDSKKYELIEGVEHFRIGPNTDGIRGISLPDRTSYSAFHIAKILRSRGVNVIHAASGVRGYELALQGIALKRIMGVPLLYEVRSFHEHTWTHVRSDVMSLEKTRLREIKENFCMAEADFVTTISYSMKNILIERGVSPEKIEVIPNAIDETRYLGKVFKAVEIPELNGADFIVGYISNMSRREGHQYLIRAIHQLRKLTGLDIRGLLVGDGPEYNSLKDLADMLGLQKAIYFAGEVDHKHINGYYMAIDLFVIPRIPDYAADWVTPLKPYEAMALERPIIVSDLPALREIVGKNEERGLIAKPADVESLVAKLQCYINDQVIRQSKVRAAKEWVFAERTWSANARRYEAIYRRLLAQRGKREPETMHA